MLDREWHLYGEQHGPMAGRTSVTGPLLKMGERVTVVPRSRLAARGDEIDDREWTLRWDHRQQRHYIDGPTDGRQIEGLVVVPKSHVAPREDTER